jgi:hypothetical protein
MTETELVSMLIIDKLFKKTYLKDNVYTIETDIDEIKKSKRSLKTKILLAKDALKELIELKSILKEEKENGRIKKDSVDLFIKFNDYQILLINEFIDLLENNKISELDRILKDIKNKYNNGGKIDTYTDEEIIQLNYIFNSDTIEYKDLKKLVNTRITQKEFSDIVWNESRYSYNKLQTIKNKLKIKKKNEIKSTKGDQISNYILPFVKTEKSSIIQRVKFLIYIKQLYMQIKNKNNLCIKDYKNKQVIGDTDNNKYIILDKRIGSESVYGEVYLSHFYKKLGSFAIKISSRNLENFRKEIEILKILTNEVLTFKCPHFPIIYGSINCNFNKENNNEIMVLNELANGDFYSFYKLYSDKDDLILNAIAQIILSLLFFYQRTKLFHKDTHGGNFLYHKIKPGGYFHYRLYGKDYYLKNLGFLWVCWDFGLATKITNKNKSNVHYDILRILGIIDNINDDIKLLDLFKTKNIDEIKDKKKRSKLLQRKQYITNMTYSKYLNDTLNDVIYDIKAKYTGTDISILDDLSLYLIEEAFKKIPSFTDITPSNIINKNPYILNKFVLKEPTKLQQEKEAILQAKTEITNLQTNVKTFKDTIKEGYVKSEKAQQAILNAKKIIANLGKARIQRPISPILEDMPNDVSPLISKNKFKSEPKFMIKKNKVSPEDYIKMKDDFKSNTYEWAKQAYKEGLTDTEILSYSGIGEKDYKLLNAFFTPDKIINDMFDLSFLYENLINKKNYNDKKPIYILECSGGIGNIIYYILETINDNNPDLLKYMKIDFVEINKEFIEIARAKLDKYKDIITYHNMSFFNFKTDKKYKFIFGNPPYKITINNKNIYDVDFFLKCWDLLSFKIMFLMSPTSITGNTKSHKLFNDIINDYDINKKTIKDESYGNQFRVYKNKEFQDKKTTQAGLTGIKTYLFVLEKNTPDITSSSSEIIENIPIVKRIKKERPISPILEDMPNDVSPPIKNKAEEAIINATKEAAKLKTNFKTFKDTIKEGYVKYEKAQQAILNAKKIIDNQKTNVKTKIKECPSGKEINPKTGRCIKIKEVKEGQTKRGRPKKIISEKVDTKPIEDKEPEKSLKKLLPNISVSFFYNVQPLIDDIKNSGYSIDYKLVKIKEILNDLQDIYDYVYEAMTQSKSSVVINKYKKFIDYTNDRINIINTYFKTLLELKFKKK